jgi:hypothetical protein
MTPGSATAKAICESFLPGIGASCDVDDVLAAVVLILSVRLPDLFEPLNLPKEQADSFGRPLHDSWRELPEKFAILSVVAALEPALLPASLEGVAEIAGFAAGVGVGVLAAFTTRETDAVAVLYAVVLFGVKVTDSVSVPTGSIVPAAGE